MNNVEYLVAHLFEEFCLVVVIVVVVIVVVRHCSSHSEVAGGPETSEPLTRSRAPGGQMNASGWSTPSSWRPRISSALS